MTEPLSGSGSPTTQALIDFLEQCASRSRREYVVLPHGSIAATMFLAAADALRSLPPPEALTDLFDQIGSEGWEPTVLIQRAYSRGVIDTLRSMGKQSAEVARLTQARDTLQQREAGYHEIITDAYAVLDCEAFPDISQRMHDTLQACDNVQCHELTTLSDENQSLKAQLSAAEGALGPLPPAKEDQ